MYIGYRAFEEAETGWTGRQSYSNKDADYAEWEKAVLRFADFIVMLLIRSDLGNMGLAMSSAIHFQIYMLLFVMQWCSWHVRVVARKITELKEASSGTYQSLELISGDNQPFEKRPAHEVHSKGDSSKLLAPNGLAPAGDGKVDTKTEAATEDTSMIKINETI